MIRISARIVLSFVFLIFLTIAPGILAGENLNNELDKLFRDYTVKVLELYPETASQFGISSKMGFTVYNDRFSDPSSKGDDEAYRIVEQFRKRLLRIDKNKLSYSRKLSAEIFEWYLNMHLEGKKYRYHKSVLNPMLGFHNEIVSVMNLHHRITGLKDANDYIKRLKAIPGFLIKISSAIDARKKRKMIAPGFIVLKMIGVMKEFTAVSVENNILFTTLENKLQPINLKKMEKDKLLNEAAEIIGKSIYPAYQRLIVKLRKMMEATPNEGGAWRLPKGNQYYAYCLRYHTTTDMSPEEIHNLGLKETARIKEALFDIYQNRLKLEGKDFEEMRRVYNNKYIRNQPGFYYTRKEVRQDQELKDFQAMIDGMEERLPELFSRVPSARVIVAHVPVFKSKTLGTHYQLAMLDGSAPGIFYVARQGQRFRPGMRTLTFHEAVPGHHFQLSLQQESPEVPLMRNFFLFTGYMEGWALYAEKLGYENGYFKNDHEIISYLESELFRAVRLVIDTGLHYKKWTRRDAYYYMVRELGWGSINEIDRYIVWPGQACSYKIGELFILKLREQARQKLGKAFRIKDFHAAVLNHGAMPLKILERHCNHFLDKGEGK